MAPDLHALRSALATGVALATAGATLLLAAPAGAAVTTFGSDLSAPANVTFKRPGAAADTAYWQAAFAGGRGTRVPVGGQIISFTVKGIAVRNNEDPENTIFLQRLVPGGSGMTVHPTGGSSQPFRMPFTGDPQQTTTFRPENFCVNQGDVIAFNDIGGYREPNYVNGVEHMVFSRVAGATLNRYTKDNGLGNGSTIPANEVRSEPDVELLMQLQLATGTDASGLCPGGGPQSGGGGSPGGGGSTPGGSTGSGSGSGSAPSTPSRTRITSPRVGVNRSGRVRLAVFCPRRVRCRGTVTLRRSGRSVGRATYSIAAQRTGRVSVRLSDIARSAIRRARTRRISVRASVVNRPGGQANTATRMVTITG